MGGARVCVHPSSSADGACLDMLRTAFCCVKDELIFFHLPVVSERTSCGCWTDLGPGACSLQTFLSLLVPEFNITIELSQQK